MYYRDLMKIVWIWCCVILLILQHNEEVQKISAQLAWGHEKVESWYKNANGRVVNNSPFSLQKYWEVTHLLDPANYNMVS